MNRPAPLATTSASTKVLLAVWALVVIAVGSLLVLKHKAELPPALASAPPTQAAIASTRAKSELGKWLAVHVLSAKCGCSARVLDALLTHPPATGLVERIVVVGDDATPESRRTAEALGYGFSNVSRDRFVEQYQLQAAPVLAILSPSNELRYLGGYSQRRRGPVLEDRNLIARTLKGELVSPLPTLGCAVGQSLAAQTNPLNL